MNKISLNLRGAMEAHQTSNLGVLSSSLSEDVFILSAARDQKVRKEKNLKRDTKDSIRVIYLKGTEENSEKVE